MANQIGIRLGTDIIRMVDLFEQGGHAITADTDITDWSHEGSEGNPAGDYAAAFDAPYGGLLRLGFSLSAAATIKLTEKAPGGTLYVHTLNEGGKLKADMLTFPIRKGFTYTFRTGESVTGYALTMDAVKE